jgi:hypothetical protein
MSLRFQDMSVENLVDLLSQHTAKLTHLLHDKEFGEEYNIYKQTIKELQEAIFVKGKNNANSSENQVSSNSQ